VLAFAEHLLNRGGIDRLLAMQLVDAATSIGSNLEEAAGAHTKPDFISKCAISLKESRESLYWLRLLAAFNRLPGGETAPLYREARELVAIISAIVKKARSSPYRGGKN